MMFADDVVLLGRNTQDLLGNNKEKYWKKDRLKISRSKTQFLEFGNRYFKVR